MTGPYCNAHPWTCVVPFDNTSRPNRSMVSSVSRTSSQVVVWLRMQSRSENFFRAASTR